MTEGVLLDNVDEASECPECEQPVEIAINQKFREIDGDIRVLELMYICPACGHEWKEDLTDG